MPDVEVRKVTKRFGKVVALKDVSFELKDKEFFTIVGPTNAGKTTTLRVVAGLEKPNKGEVFFDGRPMGQVPPYERDIALMFQNLALYPHRNGFDNIAFPLRVKKMAREEIQKKVTEVAGFLRIEHLLDRLPGTYSGGERQRVAIARTMVRDPNLYMFDEPLANLDAMIRLHMRIELRRIHQELEKTMILVTHDQVEAMTMSDRIGVLNNGKIQQIGSPDDIYMRPVNKFVGGFFGSPPMNFVNARLDSRNGNMYLSWDEYTVRADKLLARAKNLKKQTNVIFGIRPEDVLIKPGDGGGADLKGKILSLEQLGAKTVIDVELGSDRLRVSQPTTFEYKVNDSCLIEINIERGHLFDPESETNVTRS